MTEFWKSNANFWCDICKVWMTDNASTRATHEKGIKHQENVAKKLRAMRQNAESEKRQAALAVSSMGTIEAKAAEQYKRDQEEAERHRKETLGSWNPDPNTGYLYNAVHRYYLDTKTGMYYGGDPVAWTNTPKITAEALYRAEEASHGQDGAAPTAPVRTASPTAGAQRAKVARITDRHPHLSLGGHRMPTTGKIGALKGVGGALSMAETALKRKTDGVTKPKAAPKAVSKEEAEANAKREAARARVQKRTMTSFGLG